MDSSIKTSINVFTTLLGVVLLIGCVNFFIVHNNSTNILYATIQQVEIYGYDKQLISTIEEQNDVDIEVEFIDLDDFYQYEVTIGYKFNFNFLNKEKTFYVNGLTRIFER